MRNVSDKFEEKIKTHFFMFNNFFFLFRKAFDYGDNVEKLW